MAAVVGREISVPLDTAEQEKGAGHASAAEFSMDILRYAAAQTHHALPKKRDGLAYGAQGGNYVRLVGGHHGLLDSSSRLNGCQQSLLLLLCLLAGLQATGAGCFGCNFGAT